MVQNTGVRFATLTKPNPGKHTESLLLYEEHLMKHIDLYSRIP